MKNTIYIKRYKRGTNQHRIKRHFLTAEAWRDIFFIAFLTMVGIFIIMKLQPEVISPCPDGGCGAHFVKAGDPPNLTPREIVFIEGLRVFGLSELPALEKLVFKESSFNPWAVNPTSGACGLFQALPCKKMKCDLGDSVCQAKWGMSYLKKRYGTPTVAWEYHKQHGWY